MAKQFYTHIDLAKNELQNARVQNLASDPSSPAEGQVYYNTTSNKFRVFNGSTWDEMGTSEASGDMSASVYDPQAIADDAFARSNHTGTQAISTVTGLQTALNSKADTTYVDNSVANLVDTAPETLDTLNELASALGDDPNFATTVSSSIGAIDTRVDTIEANGGPTKKYTATVGGTTSITVTHNLNSQDVITQVRQASDHAVVECDIANATVNTITLGFTVAPAASSLIVTVIG